MNRNALIYQKQKSLAKKKDKLYNLLSLLRVHSFTHYASVNDDKWRLPYITNPRIIIEETVGLKSFNVTYMDRTTNKGVTLPFSHKDYDKPSKVYNLFRKLVRTYIYTVSEEM
ncbi:TPA: hypothetical protein QH056_001837 [Klebsiella oxytoca]|nr:hypothetical protein [Klebsiella oxytoca]